MRHMSPAIYAAILVLSAQAQRASDEEVLRKLRLAVSLFECGNLAGKKQDRLWFMDAGMKPAHDALIAIDADPQFFKRVLGQVPTVLRDDGPNIDCRLGEGFLKVSNSMFTRLRIGEPGFEQRRSTLYQDKNSPLLMKR